MHRELNQRELRASVRSVSARIHKKRSRDAPQMISKAESELTEASAPAPRKEKRRQGQRCRDGVMGVD